MTRATSKTHPDHTKLSEDDRWHIAILVWTGLWSKDAIAKAYGVSRRTAYNCFDRYFGAES